MEILVDLHQRRRVGLGEAGRFACPRFHAFLHEAAERLLARDQLRLFWVELDGRPAAAEFQIACGQVTYAYQAGVDPELLDLEPGRVITIATIQRAIDEGQRAMDLLRGDEPYKAHWRAEPRPTHHLRIVPPRAAARLRHGLWTAGSNVKQWFRTAPQVPS